MNLKKRFCKVKDADRFENHTACRVEAVDHKSDLYFCCVEIFDTDMYAILLDSHNRIIYTF